jgi:hypothetical protein
MEVPMHVDAEVVRSPEGEMSQVTGQGPGKVAICPVRTTAA